MESIKPQKGIDSSKYTWIVQIYTYKIHIFRILSKRKSSCRWRGGRDDEEVNAKEEEQEDVMVEHDDEMMMNGYKF